MKSDAVVEEKLSFFFGLAYGTIFSLVAKNKDLETQVKALEDQKAAKDPSYAPKEIDKDLMYSDDYVKDVQKDSGDFNWFLWLLVFPVSLGLLGWGVYAVFFKKREF
jgi:ribosome biogenesis protein Nip4